MPINESTTIVNPNLKRAKEHVPTPAASIELVARKIYSDISLISTSSDEIDSKVDYNEIYYKKGAKDDEVSLWSASSLQRSDTSSIESYVYDFDEDLFMEIVIAKDAQGNPIEEPEDEENVKEPEKVCNIRLDYSMECLASSDKPMELDTRPSIILIKKWLEEGKSQKIPRVLPFDSFCSLDFYNKPLNFLTYNEEVKVFRKRRAEQLPWFIISGFHFRNVEEGGEDVVFSRYGPINRNIHRNFQKFTKTKRAHVLRNNNVQVPLCITRCRIYVKKGVLQPVYHQFGPFPRDCDNVELAKFLPEERQLLHNKIAKFKKHAMMSIHERVLTRIDFPRLKVISHPKTDLPDITMDMVAERIALGIVRFPKCGVQYGEATAVLVFKVVKAVIPDIKNVLRKYKNLKRN